MNGYSKDSNKKIAVEIAINRLEKANRELDRRFDEQEDNCTQLLKQIQNGKVKSAS